MGIKQNLTLITLIIILLSIIFSINTLNIISIPTESKSFNNEIKADKIQLPQNYEKININIILDTSTSMWEEIDGKRKIDISKTIIKNIINNLPDSIYLGLRLTNEKGQQTINQNNSNYIIKKVKEVKESEKLNLSRNLEKATKDMINIKGKKHILLITDGQDQGDIMPSKVINQLKTLDINLHIIQVGDINKFNYIQLKTLAEIGGGNYYTYFEKDRIVPTINIK